MQIISKRLLRFLNSSYIIRLRANKLNLTLDDIYSFNSNSTVYWLRMYSLQWIFWFRSKITFQYRHFSWDRKITLILRSVSSSTTYLKYITLFLIELKIFTYSFASCLVEKHSLDPNSDFLVLFPRLKLFRERKIWKHGSSGGKRRSPNFHRRRETVWEDKGDERNGARAPLGFHRWTGRESISCLRLTRYAFNEDRLARGET